MESNNLLKKVVEQALQFPDKPIVRFSKTFDFEKSPEVLTNLDLVTHAHRLAQQLRRIASKGDRIVLCYPSGIDFIVAFYGCLFAELIAVPVNIPTNLGLVQKLDGVIKDTNPKAILTNSETQEFFKKSYIITKYRSDYPSLSLLLGVDEALTQPLIYDYVKQGCYDALEGILIPDTNLSELALLQYTSGTTSSPKGVMISHGNILHNLSLMKKAYQREGDHRILSWLPHTHDMGLIGVILLCIQNNAELYLSQPSAFIRKPLSWLHALSDFSITDSVTPCFAMKYCLDKFQKLDSQDMDLSCLQSLIIGSEPIELSIVEQFFDCFKDKGLSPDALTPAYGLAESTLFVSARKGICAKPLKNKAMDHYAANQENLYDFRLNQVISCGFPAQLAKIVSPIDGSICGAGEVGEIWLSGDSIARGYWNNKVETDRNFGKNLYADENTYFRTADLGFLSRGELFIVGRLKELIIINGVNYYPTDIEKIVLASDAKLKPVNCAVFPYREQELAKDAFVVLIESNNALTQDSKQFLINKIRRNILKVFGLVPSDVCFISKSLPKTTSGKIMRYACRSLYDTFSQEEENAVSD